jgi:hypothetical protein
LTSRRGRRALLGFQQPVDCRHFAPLLLEHRSELFGRAAERGRSHLGEARLDGLIGCELAHVVGDSIAQGGGMSRQIEQGVIVTLGDEFPRGRRSSRILLLGLC